MLVRDKLLTRLAEMRGAPDHQRLAAEVLGIRNASPELARRLVAQGLVVEDRREAWRFAGERICGAAPATPAVYILRDEHGRASRWSPDTNLLGPSRSSGCAAIQSERNESRAVEGDP